MPGVRSIAMKSIRTTILRKEIGVGPPIHKIVIIHPRIFFFNQNDVEFNFSIGHDLVLFHFF